MTVEFFDFDASGDESLGRADWSCLPLVGEHMTINGVDYVVKARDWATHVNGDGSPLWNQPYCAVTLQKESSAPGLRAMQQHENKEIGDG